MSSRKSSIPVKWPCLPVCTSAWLSGNRPGCLETGRSPNKKGAHPTKKSTEQCHSRKSNRLKEFLLYISTN